MLTHYAKDEVVRLREQVDELQEEVRQLRALLKGDGVQLPEEWGLSRSEAAIARAFISRPITTIDQISEILWGSNPEGPPLSAKNIISVRLYKLRQKVPEFRELRVKYGGGWSLPEHVRERILAQIQAH